MKQIDEDAQTGTMIFQSYVDALVEHGYALKTIKEVCDIISQCLDYASNFVHIAIFCIDGYNSVCLLYVCNFIE